MMLGPVIGPEMTCQSSRKPQSLNVMYTINCKIFGRL